MDEKLKCPYCGTVAYRDRIIIEEVKISGETGKVLYKRGSDYHICPTCGHPFGSSYGIVYRN